MRRFHPFSIVLWSGMLTSMHIAAQPDQGYYEELFPMVSLSAHSDVTCLIDSSYIYFNGLLGFRHIYQHNAEGKMTSRLVERHYEDLPWQPYWLYMYAYDEQGYPAEATSHSWSDSAWVLTALHTRTYDGQGILTEEVTQHMTGGVLTNFRWHTFDYDAESNRTDWRMFSWQNGQWMNNSWREYTYDAQDQLMEELRRNWESGAWVDLARTTNTYDGQGILVQSIEQAWYIDQWYDGVMTSYTHDTDGNLIEEIPQHMLNGQWHYGTKSVYGYDIHSNLETVMQHDWEAGAWAVGIPYQAHFYQCTVTTITTTADAAGLKVMPNPASEFVIVEVKHGRTVTFCDMAGRTVLVIPLQSSNETIGIGHLPSAVYLVTVELQDGSIMKQRLVKH